MNCLFNSTNIVFDLVIHLNCKVSCAVFNTCLKYVYVCVCFAGDYDRRGTVPGGGEEESCWCEKPAAGCNKTHKQATLSCGGGTQLTLCVSVFVHAHPDTFLCV